MIVVLSYLVYLATPAKDREKALARIVCTNYDNSENLNKINTLNNFIQSYFFKPFNFVAEQVKEVLKDVFKDTIAQCLEGNFCSCKRGISRYMFIVSFTLTPCPPLMYVGSHMILVFRDLKGAISEIWSAVSIQKIIQIIIVHMLMSLVPEVLLPFKNLFKHIY